MAGPVLTAGWGQWWVGLTPHSWANGQHARPSKPPAWSCVGSEDGHASLSAVLAVRVRVRVKVRVRAWARVRVWVRARVPAVLDGARLLWPSRHVRWPCCPCTSRTWWHGVCVEVGADRLVYSETSGPEPVQG